MFALTDLRAVHIHIDNPNYNENVPNDIVAHVVVIIVYSVDVVIHIN